MFMSHHQNEGQIRNKYDLVNPSKIYKS
jgi:hypothetical protein